MSPAPAASGRLSVVMLTASFHPYIGGTEKQALELARFLAQKEVSVSVLTRRLAGTAEDEVIDGVPVHRAPAAGGGFCNSLSFLVSSFLRLVKTRNSYDIIHVHLASSPVLAACLAARLFGKKVLVKIGGGAGIGEIAMSTKTLSGRLKLRLIAFFRPRVITVNSDLVDELKKYGLGGLKVEVFKNGVDTGLYTPPSYNEKIAAKHALGLGAGPVFLFVGRLAPEKRLIEFLETWCELRSGDSSFKARLLIVGSGPQEAAVRESARQLEISESVVIAGAQKDLLPYYRAADVFVLPSISEGLSNAMLEAMACGLAVIATKVGGARDAVAEGENGFLVDPLNRAEIKDRITRLCLTNLLAAQMGEKSRKRAVEQYAMTKIAKEMKELYQSLD